MASNQNRRLKPAQIQQDKDAQDAITTFSPVYAPSDSQFSLANLTTKKTTLASAQALEVQKTGEAAAARDAANVAEWAYHNALLGAKAQVRAQYGESSDQLQAMGLKKKSEYKRPSPKPKPTP